MNIQSVLFKIITIILGTLMMSFAWPLRGQFGHEWGAAITGAIAGCIAAILIPWKSFRQALAQAVFFGTVGFVLGGENIGYGSIIDYILTQPNLASVIPQLATILFIGASWGGIGATYLGYGISEKPISFWDYVIMILLGLGAVIIAAVINANWAYFVFFTLWFILLQLYNLFFKQSQTVWTFGFSGLIGFGLGFLGAVIILFYGNKGLLPGPPNWWTLRDQIWGGAGGLALILASWQTIGQGRQPVILNQTWFQRFGYIFFVPGICGINLWNVWTKWFQSTPPAPDPVLSAALIVIGAVLLLGWLLYYLFVNPSVFTGAGLNPMILWSFLFFCFFLRFFAIAKSIVYSGWGVWETGFTLFIFEAILFFVSIPFVLLGPENP